MGTLGSGQGLWELGRGGWGIHKGSCSPILPRIHPYQLQIKGVDIVALEKDGHRCHHSPMQVANPDPGGLSMFSFHCSPLLS